MLPHVQGSWDQPLRHRWSEKTFLGGGSRVTGLLLKLRNSAPVQTNVQGCGLYFLMTNSYVTKEIH